MGVSTNGNPDIVSQQVGAWFKQLYDVVQPGEVMSVRLTTDNKNLALVSYMHGDLDGFPMRQIAGEYYTLDEGGTRYRRKFESIVYLTAKS